MSDLGGWMSREMDGWMDKMVRGLPCSEKGPGKHKKIN